MGWSAMDKRKRRIFSIVSTTGKAVDNEIVGLILLQSSLLKDLTHPIELAEQISTVGQSTVEKLNLPMMLSIKPMGFREFINRVISSLDI
jgi:hypothetical protein